MVDLREGREGFDFLGCHFRARMSGTVWERYGKVRYYMDRWPSVGAMRKTKAKVRALTDRRWVGTELRVVIYRLNQFLRGWGGHFRTGNAARKFNQLDSYVWRRLMRFMVKKRGCNRRAGQVQRWTSA